MSNAGSVAAWAVSVAIAAGLAAAEEVQTTALPDAWMDAIEWRSIGPANMGGRITDLAVYEADPCIWYAATASGGLLKTVNNGVTFEHQFDHEATVSIGAVAVAQSNPEIVWVGTGESNPRNSVSWGDGVYKSTDGGKTWANMGLRGSYQTGRIAIHPEDPEVVYVGALGRLWGPNEERGLYKTTDGGATWEKVLYIDEGTGVVEVQMHPEDPDTLLVATYERERDGFDTNDPSKKFGPGTGIYRTTDGGATFEKLTNGLPSGNLGRVGLTYYRADPDIVYAIVESERIGKEPEDAPYIGVRGENADVGARVTEVLEDGPSVESGLKAGDIIVRVEEEIVHSYADFTRHVRHYLAGETIQLEVSRDRKSVLIDVTLTKRPGAEEDEEPDETPAGRRRRQQRGPFTGMLGGQRENVQDQQGPDGHEYGGLYRSEDGGDTWERINSINPRPMYFSQVRVDPSDNNHIYVLGVSLHYSSDGGETFESSAGRGVHADNHAMWIDPNDGRHVILGCDGGMYVTYDRNKRWDHLNHVAIGQFYHVTVGPRQNYMVYGGLQDNGSWGGPSRARSGSGPINEDWFRIGGGDGFICLVDAEDPDQIYYESQNGSMGRVNLRTDDRGSIRPRAPRGTRYRYNWKTPFILSSHNSRIHYAAGNHVFRSLNRGRNVKAISPDITRTDRGSGSALAESPLDSDVLYVGSDDGALWVTRDGGHRWIDLFDAEAIAAAEKEAADEAAAQKAAAEARAPRGEGDRPEGARGQGGEAGRGGGPGGGGGAGGRGGRGGGARGARMLETLKQADADGDGQVTRSEMPEQMGRMFDRLDADESGAIDKKEMAAFAERVRGRSGGGRGERGADAPATEGDPPAEPKAEAEPEAKPESKPEPKPEPEPAADEETAGVDAAKDAEADPLTGRWEGKITAENMPAGRSGFTLTLRLTEDGKVKGSLKSEFNDGDIEPGTFDREKGRVAFDFEGEAMSISFAARISGQSMSGNIEMQGGFSIPFEATRVGDVAADAGAEADAEAEEDPYEWAAIGDLMPEPRWVSSLEASRFEAQRVYVTFDGHRSDDDEPYLFVSEDRGSTWRSVRGDLPSTAGSVRVLREDLTSPDILYLGTEFAAWVSVDRGASWTSLNTNLPTVAVHEIAQHPTCGEIVAATHGRSLWVLDVTPLRQVTQEVVKNGVTLLKPNDAHYWRSRPSRGGDLRRFVGENPSSSARVFYALTNGAGDVSLRVTDAAGKTIRTLEASGQSGLHRASWDLRAEPRRANGNAGRRRGGPPRRRSGPRVAPGTYYIVLDVDGTEHRQPLSVKGDPDYPSAVLWGEAYDEMLEEMRELDEGGGFDGSNEGE